MASMSVGASVFNGEHCLIRTIKHKFTLVLVIADFDEGCDLPVSIT